MRLRVDAYETKVFGGRRYSLDTIWTTKPEVTARKKLLKMNKRLVRTIQRKNKYFIYVK